MRRFSGVAIAGLLIPAIGFLTSQAAGAPVDDALDDLSRLEARRDALVRQADSLGTLHVALQDPNGREARQLLERSEELSSRASDLEAEILLVRQTCRVLVQRELDERRADPSPIQRQRELVLYDLLENRLSDSWEGQFVLVVPDSLDGLEGLLDKKAYLEDLKDRILDLESRVERRIERARREAALREASDRFAQDSRFLDEGGRVGSDETVWMRGIGSEDGAPGEGQGKATVAEGTGFGGDPADVSGGAGWRDVTLQGASWHDVRAGLQADLSRVQALLEQTDSLVRSFGRARP